MKKIDNVKDKWALNAIQKEARKRKILYCILLILLFTSVITPLVIFNTMSAALRKPQQVAIIDPAGNLFVSPLKDTNASQELLFWCGSSAANAMLARRPEGFDFPQVVDMVFQAEALKKLNQEMEAFKREAIKTELRWKLELRKIEAVPSTQPETYIVKITGTIIELSHYGNVFETRPRPFELGLVLVRNGELISAGRFPYVVQKYNLNVK